MKRGHSSDDIAVVDDTSDSTGPSDNSGVAETANQRQHQKKARRTQKLTDEQLWAIDETIAAHFTDSHLGPYSWHPTKSRLS